MTLIAQLETGIVRCFPDPCHHMETCVALRSLTSRINHRLQHSRALAIGPHAMARVQGRQPGIT